MDNSWIGNYSYSRSLLNGASVAVVDIDTGLRYTYSDLDMRANKLANLLSEKFDVKKGDRIAYISRNRVEMLDAYFATGKLGAVLVPYNARLSHKELTLLMTGEKPKVLFYEPEFASKVGQLADNGVIKHFVALKSDINPLGHPVYDDLLKESSKSPVSCPSLDIEDTHLIIHTGGTTGLPKGALISHRCELFNAFSEICTWGLRYDDKTVLLLPLFHTGGWNLLTLPMLHVGACVYLSRQFNPRKTMEIVESEKIDYLFGAATIFRMLVEDPYFEKADLSSLRWIMAGAAPTPLNIMQTFWDRGVKIVLGYGMTEAGPNNLSSPPELLSQKTIEEKYASVGVPFYFTMPKLIDNDGNPVTGPDTPGELLWSGPQIFSGYWDNEKETENTLIDGWVHTGDMVSVDKDGFYYIVGRKKNMFISGGENVFPPEIENALYEIKEIKEACVFGVPDEKWGEVGKAVVSLKPGMSIDKAGIVTQLKTKLAKYKVPKFITFVDDVPKNSVGKIVVREIQKLYGEARD